MQLPYPEIRDTMVEALEAVEAESGDPLGQKITGSPSKLLRFPLVVSDRNQTRTDFYWFIQWLSTGVKASGLAGSRWPMDVLSLVLILSF